MLELAIVYLIHLLKIHLTSRLQPGVHPRTAAQRRAKWSRVTTWSRLFRNLYNVKKSYIGPITYWQ